MKHLDTRLELEDITNRIMVLRCVGIRKFQNGVAKREKRVEENHKGDMTSRLIFKRTQYKKIKLFK